MTAVFGRALRSGLPGAFQLPVVLSRSQVVKQCEMTFQGADKGSVLVIGQAEFPGGFLDYDGNFPVMNVANIWEQVVFDLVVEPADEPGKEAATIGEIGGRSQLVNSPVVLDTAIVFGNEKISFFKNVRRLKDQSQHQPANEMHGEETQQRLPPGQR
jgi:hypothetical protein